MVKPDPIERLTEYFSKRRKEEITDCFGEEAVERDKSWVGMETSFWYKRIKDINPNLTEKQTYMVARKFLNFRFSEDYYERMFRERRKRSHPRFEPSPIEVLAKLKEINEKDLVNRKTIEAEMEATDVAEQYLIELINKSAAEGKP